MLGVCMALIDDEKDKKAFEKLYNKYKNKVHALSLIHISEPTRPY